MRTFEELETNSINFDQYSRFRLQAIQADIEFTNKLLGSSLFSSHTPNLYERLQLFRQQGSSLSNSLESLQREEGTSFDEFERNYWLWKIKVNQYLSSKI